MLKRLVTLGALAAGAIALVAAPASADSGAYIYWNGYAAGYGSFQSYGDHWTVCDIAGDGYGVNLHWLVPATGRTGFLRDGDGNNGNCYTQNVNIGEGRGVQYYLCLTNGGTYDEFTCTGWIYDTA